jgi:hypothetical protein
MTKIIPLNEVYPIADTNVFYHFSKNELTAQDDIVAQDVKTEEEKKFKLVLYFTPLHGIKKGLNLYMLTEKTELQAVIPPPNHQ